MTYFVLCVPKKPKLLPDDSTKIHLLFGEFSQFRDAEREKAELDQQDCDSRHVIVQNEAAYT